MTSSERASSLPQIIIRTGTHRITQVFRDIVETCKFGEQVHRINSGKNVDEANKYIPSDYHNIRTKKELQLSLITLQHVANKKIPRLDRNIAVISEQWNEFDNNISFTLYGNKISYVDFNTETSIVIENKHIAAFQKKTFQILVRYIKHCPTD